ncbi:MAG: peptidase S15 [Olpidium bornovanus]|uniref:Peptidase S15 n=1 Tax=Olpidium bornovanus TaxID=278681 RepID=A0A8H7ZR02_9FUNG|nr:MAG: peptidase S15 [Olpidium bornovanus]
MAMLTFAAAAVLMLSGGSTAAKPAGSQTAWKAEERSWTGSRPDYGVTHRVSEITMKDGVNLSVTYTLPDPKYYGEAFPFFLYFGRRGYVVAKVDIRGTGSSGGRLVNKEYSEVELDDGAEIIRQLAHMTWNGGAVVSNRRVAMYGQSWGAFNALMLASRQTPYLATVYALHGSEDLYYNDVHYLDGVVHKDEYILSVDHENALPRWPAMKIDEEFIGDRFNATPWHMVYLQQQVDSPFWRNNSGMYHYDRFRIPMYLVGGIYDAYADFCLRYYDGIRKAQADPPRIKCTIGPWNHAWPQVDPDVLLVAIPADSLIGPNYDGLGEAVRWFDQWMKDYDTGILDEPDFTTFVRASHKPDPNIAVIPGQWRGFDWPVPSTKWERMSLSVGGRLEPLAKAEARSARPCERADASAFCLRRQAVLPYKATVGTEMGTWWGETLGDQADLDADSQVFDSGVLAEEVTVIGFPKVSLRVSSTAKLAHWAVRLEDVHPDGKVSHVTGALRNGAHRAGRERPAHLEPGEDFVVLFDLHFTTWTFPPGHRIRVAVSNALFRVVWPSPERMNTTLFVDQPDTWVELPTVPPLPPGGAFVPPFTQTPVPAEATAIPADSTKYKAGGYPRRYAVERVGSKKLVTTSADYYFRIKGALVGAMLTQRWIADDENPARSAWLNEARQLYVWDYPADASLRNAAGAAPALMMMSPEFRSFHESFPDNFPSSSSPPPATIPSRTGDSPSGWVWVKQAPGADLAGKRWIELHTKMSIVSDEEYFYSSLTRSIYENGTLISTKSFEQKDRRRFQ